MCKIFLFTRQAWDEVAKDSIAAGVNETGWRFLGLRTLEETPDGVRAGIVVLRVIGPGPCATATPWSFSGDLDFQQGEVNRSIAKHPHWVLVGEGHKHPAGYPRLSAVDVATAVAVGSDPRCRFPHGRVPLVITTVAYGRATGRAFVVSAESRAVEDVETRVHPTVSSPCSPSATSCSS